MEERESGWWRVRVRCVWRGSVRMTSNKSEAKTKRIELADRTGAH